MTKMNKCHPDKPFFAKAMCQSCYNANYRAKNKTYLDALTSKWHKDNKDQANANKIAWALKNPDKVKETKRAYVQRNLSSYRAMCAKRHASKMQRTPIWADLKAIKEFYTNCPAGMEVDHIVPMQGKNVSGLHVLSNLQYLTKSENAKKHNKFGE